MKPRLRLKPLCLSLSLMILGSGEQVFAAGPYPSLPPALSTSVSPNIIFYIDTSGSMVQDANNQWMQTGLCDSNSTAWNLCIDNNVNGYRTAVDSEVTTPNSKMNIAKRVTRSVVQKLIDDNLVTDPVTSVVSKKGEVRVGLFSFHNKPTNIGGAERGEGSILRAEVRDVSVAANQTSLNSAINALDGRTATPLGEGLLEITRYLQGSTTLYAKPYPGAATSYVSPIQYRCQKNFTIVVTDGNSTNDDNFPANLPYTARDSSGTAVSKTFNVCSATNAVANNDLDVNCPAALEGSAGTPGFGSASDRFRSVRDVAKYARVADLRVGGNDLDGKTFDDPKFSKQNLNTYTVGFSVTNDVLPATAIAGGGKSYSATDETSLTSALNQAVNSIVASTSNAGGVATQSETTLVGNKLFQPVFNPGGWRGELRCFQLDASNSISTSCAPNAIAVIPTPTNTGVGGRKVYTSKVVGTTTTAFNFADTVPGSYTANQLASLGTTSALRKETINFVRGVNNISGTRSRTDSSSGTVVLLGDIVDGQPLVVSTPSGTTYDVNYPAFITANASRNIVLVGANDGMLHAFRVDESTSGAGDNMNELMAYVPSAVYPNLKTLKSTDYGTNTEPHVYHVNGNLKQADMKLSTGWTTLVAGGLGQGGQGYFAIDVKNSAQLGTASGAVKWEWTDVQSSSMGYAFSAPLLYNVRTSSSTVVPAVIVSNGYESDYDDTASGGTKTASGTKASVLYIINAETGALLRAISAPSGGGLSSPAGLDVGQDGILDYVYAGDLNGKLWRFDLTGNDPAAFTVATNPIFDAGVGHPITARPAVLPVSKASDGSAVGNIVLFGTGQLLTDSDRYSTTTQYLYGILDKMASTPTTVPNTVSSTSLQQQTVVGLNTNTDISAGPLRSYRRVSNNAIDLTADGNTLLGWRMPLPTSSERSVNTPAVFNNRVIFGTGIPIASEKCLPGGSGWIMGLNPLTGSSARVNNLPTGAEYSFIDLNGDKVSTAADQRLFAAVPAATPVVTTSAYASGFSLDGIPTEISYVANSTTLSGPTGTYSNSYGDAGSVVALREVNSQGVFTGNGNGSESRGRSVPVKEYKEGTGCVGTVGDDKLTCVALPGGPGSTTGSKAKVFTTIWREIK